MGEETEQVRSSLAMGGETQPRSFLASAAVRPSNDVTDDAVLYRGEKEQVRPLAPSTFRSSSDGGAAAMYMKKMRHKRCFKCCGCVAALLLILGVVVVILVFTVFRVKDPIIKLNGVTVDKLDLVNGTTTPRPGSNMSLTADVSVKNPNVASFKYKNTTTALFYRGAEIGEARGPPGRAKSRRTMRMNITIDIITDRLMSSSFLSDMKTGLLTISSFTRVPGRVKILSIVKKHVVVKMNCTMSINTTTRAIQDQKCRRKVKL